MSKEQEFPPVVQILLDEQLESLGSVKDVKSWWTKITPELRRQAEWTVENYCYPDSEAHTKKNDFLLRVSGGLDPFSTTEICAEIGCRVAALDQFGRTVGLFADEIVIPDIFTLQCLRLKKSSGEHAHSLIQDLILLNRLRPLIEAGVIRFGTGHVQYCQTHYEKAYDQIKSAAAEIIDAVQSELSFRRNGDYISVFTGTLYEPEVVWLSLIPPKHRKKRTRHIGLAAFRHSVERQLAATMRDLRSAERLSAVLASNSRIGMLAVKSLESHTPDIRTLDRWEAVRSVSLPWVENLSPAEVVRIREEAAGSLPRLRALLAEKLSTPTDDSDARVAEIVNELRNEAAEVEAELGALNIGGERKFRTFSGALGLTVTIYGVAAGLLPVAAGLGSLLSLLGLIHAAERNDKKQYDLLTSRPGYVLIKARDIATHRHTTTASKAPTFEAER